MLPREHGAWALLIVPIILGIWGAPSVSPLAAGLFSLGALGAFLLRVPVQELWSKGWSGPARRWLGLYAALAALGFVPLLLICDRLRLLAFAAPAAAMAAINIRANLTGRRFSAANELAGVSVLCLGAPAAYYAVSGTLDGRAWLLWLLSSAYFIGPIFHVKLAALQHRAGRDPSAQSAVAAMGLRSKAYHGIALAAAGAAVLLDALSWLAAVPFAAAFLKAVLRAARPAQKVDFRALGFQEVAHSALFAVCVGAALR